MFIAEDFENAPEGEEGFLSDLDFAWANPSSAAIVTTEKVGSIPHGYGRYIQPVNSTSDTRTKTIFLSQRGAVLTGNVQFMATALLKAIDWNEQHTAAEQVTVTHTHEHDAESLTWVMAYSVLRNMIQRMANKAQRDGLNKLFSSSFGQVVVSDIRDKRETLKLFIWVVDKAYPDAPTVASKSLRSILSDIGIRMGMRTLRQASETIQTTHNLRNTTVVQTSSTESRNYEITWEWLLEIVEKEIGYLEEDPDVDVYA
ncbi:hypothetical protein OF83DRAFT_1180350 [Amylostereum chailletii]|nr:hypothetical protein OF83DRAFT_1180350 [Amylostereum chailletii]